MRDPTPEPWTLGPVVVTGMGDNGHGPRHGGRLAPDRDVGRGASPLLEAPRRKEYAMDHESRMYELEFPAPQLSSDDGEYRIALHARELSFTHPTRGEVISIVAPVPADWPESSRAWSGPPSG